MDNKKLFLDFIKSYYSEDFYKMIQWIDKIGILDTCNDLDYFTKIDPDHGDTYVDKHNYLSIRGKLKVTDDTGLEIMLEGKDTYLLDDNDEGLLGIDFLGCFDKLKKCDILVKFPLNGDYATNPYLGIETDNCKSLKVKGIDQLIEYLDNLIERIKSHQITDDNDLFEDFMGFEW